MIGEVLCDRYQIQQQLGKRAGRQTLLARDLTTGELVVVKLLSFGSDFEWEHLKLFEREAKTLKALSHPAIPRYLDYLEIDLPTGKGFALVQTYVEGKSLEEHLKAGRKFTETEVKQLAKALLEILIYLHGLKPPVIHRDIKPSNILLTNRSGNNVGEVYLVDFGSVQTLAAREGGTITVVGTYGYMPPEQFGGRAVAASDLYSLGATLIYLVTGTHPADLPQIDLQIQFEQAANLSQSLVSWLKCMTEASLNRRLGSAEDALQALAQPQQREAPQRRAPHSIVRKPFGSKVLLAKNVDSLEILLPPEGFTPNIQGCTTLAIFWSSIAIASFPSISDFFFSYLSFVNLFSSVPFLLLMALAFYGVGIFLVLKILFAIEGRVRLRLNQQQMTLTYEFLELKYNCPPVSLQEISRLVHTKRSVKTLTFNNYNNHYTERQVVEEKDSRLIIWAGAKKYELSNENVITEPEIDWLAQELSNWLGLPITRE
jgi:serine/threonine protein kinase